ncbi:hypothetical protein BQ8420_23735 [Nocardiopsis sp. JB363]|nr:hypothetical protein BQ8420_23735 [Nocardiopsis sp. JB363]
MEIERWRFSSVSAVPLLLEDELPIHHRPDHWPTHSRLHWIAKAATDQGRILIGPTAVPENVRWSEPGMGPMSAYFHRVSPTSGENGGGGFLLQVPSSAGSTSAWEFDLPDADTTAVVGLVKTGAMVHREHTWLRGQLGLDAYEGRSRRGWNRHCTLVATARRFQTEIGGAAGF